MGNRAMKLSRFIRLAACWVRSRGFPRQAQAPARSQIAGNVTAVDSGKQQISLQTDKGETVTLCSNR